MNVLAVIGVILLIVVGLWFALLGIVGAIDKWANSDPAVNDIFDYSAWKREQGFYGYISPKADKMLRKQYDARKR